MRYQNALRATVFSLCLSVAMPATVFAEDLPSREEMWKIIQAQQEQLQELQALVKSQNTKIEATGKQAAAAEAIAQETEIKISKTAKKVEKVAQGYQAGGASTSPFGSNNWWERTSFNGYGELHYNGGDVDEIDFHRFVFGINHQFNEDVRLISEIEIEHTIAGDGQEGEVLLEQALVQFDLTEDDAHRVSAGLFLIPVGILNEVHEPPTFYGVERNPVEVNIIPTTFFEGGVLFSGNLGESGFSYDAGVHSGLQTDTTGSNAFRIRSGRQKVSEAEATDPAYTGRIKWSGYPGVTLASTVQYQTDITQDSGADDENIDALLWEANAQIQKGGWGLRALYAQWDIDGDGPAAVGRDEQYGYYIEPSYRFDVPFGLDDGEGELGFFARYNQYDNAAGDSADSEFEQVDIGFNYWPIPNVVLKADFAFIDGPTPADDDSRLNLGIGYQFN